MLRRSSILLILGLLLANLTLGATDSAAQGRGQGFRPCPYRPYDCPLLGVCKPIKVSGKISRVFTETLTDDMYPGMALLLDTKELGKVHVHLGPVWFLERQEFELQPGQEVTVQGICVEEGKATRLVAAQVMVGDQVLILRDPEGRPVWEAWRKR